LIDYTEKNTSYGELDVDLISRAGFGQAQYTNFFSAAFVAQLTTLCKRPGRFL
jgi:hypothetical protein